MFPSLQTDVAQKRAITNANPQSGNAAFGLWLSLVTLGDAFLRRWHPGDSAECAKCFEECLTIAMRFGMHASDAAWAQRIASSYFKCGQLEMRKGRLEAATDHFRESLGFLDELCSDGVTLEPELVSVHRVLREMFFGDHARSPSHVRPLPTAYDQPPKGDRESLTGRLWSWLRGRRSTTIPENTRTLYDCDGEELAVFALGEFADAFIPNQPVEEACRPWTTSGRSGGLVVEGNWWRACVSDKLKVNAEIRPDGDRPLFMITSGMILAVMDGACTVVAHLGFLRDLVPYVPAEKHTAPTEPVARYYDYSPAPARPSVSPIDVFNARPYEHHIPDRGRQQLVHALFEGALKFIAAHEQGHWLSGHVRTGHSFALDTGDSGEDHKAAVESTAGGIVSQEKRLFRRRQELQADTVAVQLLMSKSRYLPADLRTPFNMMKLSEWDRFAASGIALVLGILALRERHLPKTPESCYPPLAIRALNALKHIVAAVCDSSKQVILPGGETATQAVLGERADIVLGDMQVVFAALGVEPLSTQDLHADPSALSPNNRQLLALQQGIPALRQMFRGRIVEVLDDLSRRSKPDRSRPKTPCELDICLRGLSPIQLQYELMKCCADNGAHIPWDTIGSSRFADACMKRGSPLFEKRFPLLTDVLTRRA